MEMTAMRDVELCSDVETDRRFGGAVSIIDLIMEVESTSETSVNFY
jgi:hypothetical protein